MKKYNENKDKDYYTVTFFPDFFDYIGITDENFTRNFIGINRFTNNDIYIGNWENDKHEGDGFYIHRYKSNSINKIDLFLGEWKNNKRSFGLYFWGENLKEDTIDEQNFDLFYGDFKANSYQNGFYLSKRTEENKPKFYLYKGEFIPNPQTNEILKHGENCVIFSQSERKFIIGKVSKDILKSGKVYILNENEFTIKEIYDCNFDQNEQRTIPKEVKFVQVTNDEKAFPEKILKSVISVIEKPGYLSILHKLISLEKINKLNEFEEKITEISNLIQQYKHFEFKEYFPEKFK